MIPVFEVQMRRNGETSDTVLSAAARLILYPRNHYPDWQTVFCRILSL